MSIVAAAAPVWPIFDTIGNGAGHTAAVIEDQRSVHACWSLPVSGNGEAASEETVGDGVSAVSRDGRAV